MVKHKTRLGDLFLVPAVLCCMDTTNVSQSPSDSLDLARELADPAKVFEITRGCNHQAGGTLYIFVTEICRSWVERGVKCCG